MNDKGHNNDDLSQENSVLLNQRDELMNSILEDEDALITEHRRHIEYTMTIVRLEMSLLTEVGQISQHRTIQYSYAASAFANDKYH